MKYKPRKLLAIWSTVIFISAISQLANAQPPPVRDSVHLKCTMLPDHQCGDDTCNHPCKEISIRNDDLNWQIIHAQIQCVQSNCTGMTLCSVTKSGGITWGSSCPLGTCEPCTTFCILTGPIVFNGEDLRIDECGCCKFAISVQFNDPAQTVYSYTLDCCP
jgi:hypothetical protein